MQGKKTVQELAVELNQLLARFKRNIDAVGSRELLKENYAAAYKKAVEVLRVTANSYVVALLESHVWPIHPDFEKEEMEIIKNVIESSGMVKKMSKRMMQQFSVEGLPEMADELYWLCRKEIEPYTALKTGFIIDFSDPSSEWLEYNLLTREVKKDGRWIPINVNWDHTSFVLFEKQKKSHL